jgi:glycosyltransferase involved in cell wall biosynthesis
MKNFGKSQALHAGFAKAQGDVIITMDADLQDSPEEIPGLYNMITQNFDLFPVGRKKRYDSVVAKTYLQNYSTGRLENVWVELNDFNCGLKAIK